MPRSFIETFGHSIGRKVAQAKNAFDLMSGTDEESLKAEVRLGHDMAAAYVRRTALVEEDATTRFVAQTGRWLGTHLQERRLPVTVFITAEPEPNAMALPGGTIFISRSLVDLCRSERDQIAFIVGHELAHVVLRHTLERIWQDAALSLLLKKASPGLAASNWMNDTGRAVLKRGFNRKQEFEADVFSERLIKRAGGDPLASEDFLSHAAQAINTRGGANRVSYFATHPSFNERIANLQKAAATESPMKAAV